MKYIMNRFLGERVWCHAQDLRKAEKGTGGPYGRAWLHVGRASWEVGWMLGKHSHGFALTVDIGGESDASVFIALPLLFVLWFSVEGLFPYRWLPRNESRKTGIRAFGTEGVGNDTLLCIDIWNEDSWGGRNKPKWQKICINLGRLVYGNVKHVRHDLASDRVWIYLPEGPLRATVQMFESVWTWPRLRKAQRLTRAEITPDTPIKVPGKGENRWDCGDDATYSLTCVANTPQDAAAALVASVMRARRRAGGA